MEEILTEKIAQEAQKEEIKYYANVDEKGKLVGWYNTDIHSEDAIPTPKIEVTKEAWQNAINNGHNKVNEDGTTELFDFRSKEELDKEINAQKVQEARNYLTKTDFKMTVDYYATLTEVEQLELTTKRAEAREFIRTNDVFNS